MSDNTTGRTPAEGANPLVDHPAHYNKHPSGVECIEIIRHMGWNLGAVVKHIWRDGLKDVEVPLQDLEKAAWYLADEIGYRRHGNIRTIPRLTDMELREQLERRDTGWLRQELDRIDANVDPKPA